MHQFINRIVGGCLILALLMNTVGCYSFKQISSTDASPGVRASEELDQVLSSLSVGNTVKVRLRDGATFEGTVKSYKNSNLEIERRTWQGKMEIRNIARTDIDAIYMKNFSGEKTAVAVVGGVGGVIVILGGVFLLLILPNLYFGE